MSSQGNNEENKQESTTPPPPQTTPPPPQFTPPPPQFTPPPPQIIPPPPQTTHSLLQATTPLQSALSRKSSPHSGFPSQTSYESETEEDDYYHKSVEYADKIKNILTEGDELDPEFLLNQHVLFTQMDILCSFPCHSYGWKEMSRWLKYEEKVDASGRWSKPHVSTVSLRALMELKRLLEDEKVVLMLDFETEGKEWTEVRETIVQKVTTDLGLNRKSSQRLLSILAAPHKHKGREGVAELKGGPKRKRASLRSKSFIRKDGKDLWDTCSSYPKHLTPDDLEPYQADKSLRKRLPKHAEVCNVWVGCIDFNSKPICLFCRFKEPLLLPEASEVDLPTRLLFLTLSNQATPWQMHELGRAVSIVLNDKIFCEVVYKAESKDDLLTGVHELIDDVCILPPSVWDPTIRLDPPSVTMTMERICKRLVSSKRTAAQVEQIFEEGSCADESLKRSHTLFGGLVKDVKRRYCTKLSDVTDGFHIQCISSIIFLFFACITPIVTFGGLMASMTGGYIGTIEMLISGTFCGITYAIFSGQPLVIVGATGPLLVFEGILYELCVTYKVPFLPIRFWIGAWAFMIMMLIVAFDLSCYIKYITRFTEESFSVLISLIFIGEALKKLHDTWLENRLHTDLIHEPRDFFCRCNLTSPASLSNSLVTLLSEECLTAGPTKGIEVNRACLSPKQCQGLNGTIYGPGCVESVVDSVPDVFLLSTILLFGTFAVAIFLRSLRSSTYFPQVVRSGLADFSVVISLVLWTTVDYLIGINTSKLDIPSSFRTTKEGRPWLVNPLDMDPWWMGLLAFLPACLFSILIFLDQQITAVIINKKENKLEKGHGYHLDLFVITFQVLTCSVFGLPWFCAATVRSISHVQSLIKVSEFNAPGEPPKMIGVREQRVTGFIIHVLIGFSIFGATFLKVIPMPVLYGVFFFMGVVSLARVQFVDRVLLMLMPLHEQPDYVYLRHVETSYVYLFTVIQVLCMLLMWLVKSFKATSLAFPITLIVLVVVRKLMDKFLKQKELFWLDNILPESSRRTKEDQLRAIDFANLPSERRRSTRIAENYFSSNQKIPQ